jgi:hypothetical protein
MIGALSMLWMEATDDCPCSVPRRPSGRRASLIELNPAAHFWAGNTDRAARGPGWKAVMPSTLCAGSASIMVFTALADLGWDEAWSRSFDQLAEPGALPGRVIEQQRGLWLCATASGDRLCRQPGHSALLAAAGDWVVIDPGAESDPSRIRAILPRRRCWPPIWTRC